MGMFDHIKCEYQLPNPEVQSEIFQSKDFDCLMDMYTITRDGILVCRKYNLDGFDDKDKEMFKEDILVPYHGYIRFYTSFKREWYEYSASFVFGRLEKIVRINRGG